MLIATFILVSGTDRCQFSRLQPQWTTAAYWCCRRTSTALWYVTLSCIICLYGSVEFERFAAFVVS